MRGIIFEKFFLEQFSEHNFGKLFWETNFNNNFNKYLEIKKKSRIFD